ncbi:hypothetical protein AGMMS50230_15510 [Spirochaetia bacterium]|nr:hypothetical protein AGMMS50230_15510 [Spirochaetia bacterium]
MAEDIAEFKSYLDSLTTRDLAKLADQSGIDIPPDLDRLFIIRELLDAVEEEEDTSPALDEKPDLETAPLPKQYHITYLEVLPRDPRWAYVFWEIKAQDRERYEGSSRFEGYVLKALEIKDGKQNESFSVPVKNDDNSWYLGFPPGGGTFRVALWVRGLDISLIVSRPFELPRFLNSPEFEELLTRPLIRLSGAANFDVLRNQDRVSRRFHE